MYRDIKYMMNSKKVVVKLKVKFKEYNMVYFYSIS